MFERSLSITAMFHFENAARGKSWAKPPIVNLVILVVVGTYNCRFPPQQYIISVFINPFLLVESIILENL